MTTLNRTTPEITANSLKEAIRISDDFNNYCVDQRFCDRNINLSGYNYSKWFELSSDDYAKFINLITEDRLIFNRWHCLPEIDVSLPRESSGDFISALLTVIDESTRDFLPYSAKFDYVFASGFPASEPHGNEFMMELRSLMVDVAIAGHGNLDHLRKRAGALDSDAFATETMRKARSSMRPRERLATVVSRYSNYVNNRYLNNNKQIVLPIFIVTFTNAEISISPNEMGLLFKNMKHMNVPNLFFVSINDLHEEELEHYVNPYKRSRR